MGSAAAREALHIFADCTAGAGCHEFSHNGSNVSPPSFECLSPLREKLVSLVDGCNA
jgi:hypothetical protein